MKLSDTVFKELETISKKGFVTREKEDLLCYSYDAVGESYLPCAIVFPNCEKEISEILKLASKEKFIVIPRGSGSGLTGGVAPIKGGVVLVTSRMNKILEINENNFYMRVQPGAVVLDIHKSAAKKKLFYPPDPASSSFCTIGGNIGECAGGPCAVKYGVTRDYVLGLRAVLPTGQIINTGVATAKGVAGYDLTRLIVGSEGTLAIITEITLKLLPKPQIVKTMAVFFDSVQKATLSVVECMKNSIIPRCIEYVDQACLELIKDKFEFDIPQNSKALLILELDGDIDFVEKSLDIINDLCISPLKIIMPKDKNQAQNLWNARKALSPIMYKIASGKINEDIVVPVDKIPDIVVIIQELEKESGLKLISFGHAGDGNIHCNIMYDKSDKKQELLAKKTAGKLFDATLKLGGTITGEHGIGITKKEYLLKELGTKEVELMKGIKKVFDPHNILNPGKIFD